MRARNTNSPLGSRAVGMTMRGGGRARLRSHRWPLPGCAVLLALACSSGCATAGGAASAGQETSTPARGRELSRLTELAKRQAQRLAELETRISLLEAESRRQRAAAAGKLSETVRIGRSSTRSSEQAPEGTELDAAPMQDAGEGPPLSLRLHGRPVRAEAPLEPVPDVNERLPVTPLPGQVLSARGARAVHAAEASAVTPSEEARAAYRRALGLLKRREFDQALMAFEGFLHSHPAHPLVPSAVYWQAEVHYAKRNYAEALLGFTQVLDRFPGSDKAPKALYKLALCHQRLGDRVAAERCLARLRKEFPDSALAKRASAEGSS